jgi:hypothetical protein
MKCTQYKIYREVAFKNARMQRFVSEHDAQKFSVGFKKSRFLCRTAALAVSTSPKGS